jgi:dTDP-4-amino-4,6-dideoxygalactose transaminase
LNIPFLDLKIQYQSIKHEIDPAIQNILDTTAFVLGKSVSDFEKAFAEAHQVKHCVAVSSGTDGNHLALWVLGIQAGDEVIVPANTFIATAWGATLCGAKPVFVDCEPDSYNIDPTKVEQAITPKTKAIVPVHLYGQSADLDKISEELRVKSYELKDNGVFVHSKTGQTIYLVEDCAQAHIAEYKNQRVGGLSEIASFSFYPGKNLGAYGEGGAVTTNDDALAKKVTMLRAHGAEEKYLHEFYGHNYRMEGIQGAVLGVKLKHLNEWTEKRRVVAQKYKELLSNVEQVKLPVEKPYAKHVYHLYVIQTTKRNELQKYLQEQGISTGLHYPVPLHLQPCFASLGYKRGDFPNAEQISDNGLSLPMFAEMTDEQIGYVAEKIKKFYR